MEKFFEHLEKERHRINSILNVNKPMNPLTLAEQKEYAEAKTCKNCGTEFDDGMFVEGPSPSAYIRQLPLRLLLTDVICF